MKQKLLSGKLILLAAPFMVVLILIGSVVSSGLRVSAQSGPWRWEPEEKVFDILQPGIAYETDTILAVLRFKPQLIGKLKPPTATIPEWLRLFAKQANDRFQGTVQIGKSFRLDFEKSFPLNSSGSTNAEVCSDENELIRFRITSTSVDLKTIPIKDKPTMLRIQYVVMAAQSAVAKEILDGKVSGISAANFINWPLPNGTQIPAPATQKVPDNTLKDDWAKIAAYGTPNPDLPRMAARNQVVVAVLDTGKIDESVVGSALPPLANCDNTLEDNQDCNDGYGRTDQGPDRFNLPKNTAVGHGSGVGAIINDPKFGIAPGVVVKHVKVCSFDSVLKGFDCPTEAIVQALCKVPRNLNPGQVSQGEFIPQPRVINLSFGSVFKSEIIERTLKDISKANILVIAAAGNSRNKVYEKILIPESHSVPYGGGVKTYPAQYASSEPPLVIAVGATTSDNTYADFSTMNPYVTLAAPGENVTTAQSTLKGKSRTYAQFTGTSFAAPYVTGAAALLIAKFKIRHGNQDPSATQLITYLTSPTLKPVCPTSGQSDQPGSCGRQLNISSLLNLVQ